MTEPIKSVRGVYYDLTKSPYEFTSPYGDLFKFPSKKKLDMYTRDIEKELDRINKVLMRNALYELLPDEIITLLHRTVYHALYRKIVEV